MPLRQPHEGLQGIRRATNAPARKIRREKAAPIHEAGTDLLPFAQGMPPAAHPQPPAIEGAV